MGAYHKTLGVPEGATEAEIKKAYRKLASELHPDKHAGKSPDEIKTLTGRFQEVQVAHDRLMDGKSGPAVGFRSSDINLNEEMEEIMRRWGAQPWNTGRPVYTQQSTIHTVEVPIETMFKGGIVNFTTMSPAQTGQGYLQFTKKTWSIKLDPDTPVEHIVTVKEGKEETKFIIRPSDTPTYVTQGIDLIMEKEIDLFDALVGGSINIRHPSGSVLKVKVPSGVTNDSAIRVNGKGMLHTNGTRGDLYIHASVKIPTLNDTEVKIIREAIKKIRKK